MSRLYAVLNSSRGLLGEATMKASTKDEIAGKIHEVKGNIKEKAGRLTNDAELEANALARRSLDHSFFRLRCHSETQALSVCSCEQIVVSAASIVEMHAKGTVGILPLRRVTELWKIKCIDVRNATVEY